MSSTKGLKGPFYLGFVRSLPTFKMTPLFH